MSILPKVETKRLVIRPFQEKDLNCFLEFMLDENATKYLMFEDEQKTEEGAKGLFQYVIESYTTDEPVHSYVVANKETDEYIGSCGISKLFSDQNIYECYYSILPRHWRQGYATESTKALIDYCFANLGIQEMRAYMSPENPYSQGVAEKVGMESKGIQKHPQFQNEGLEYILVSDDYFPLG